MPLFQELKRRNVFRVGVAYAVGAWLLLQFTEVLSELLKLPDQVGPIVVSLVAIGFPVVLFLSWAFELTPEGIKRESEVDRTTSITHQTGRRLDRFIIGMLVFVAAYFIWESRFSDRRGPATDANEMPTIADSSTASNTPAADAPEEEAVVDPRSIAVLPFDNRSRMEDDAFFVEGVHDDLLTNLARVSGLKVISRTSVSRYANSSKSIPEIAQELGVATVMEGAVQRSGDTVRVNVQLIDAVTDEHLWAEIFDRELTAENLFDIQSEISERIAGALKAELTDDENARLVERPTDNLEAYTAYLRGRQLMKSRRSEGLEAALAQFTRATALDPEFALAWVGIADANDLLAGYSTLELKDSIEAREVAVATALRLDPELGEAHLAQAALRVDLEQDPTADFKRAIELSPGYATAYHWYAMYLDNKPEGIPEAIQMLNQALELDPLSSIIRSAMVSTLTRQGNFTRAQYVLDGLLEQDPEFPPAYQAQAILEAHRGRGDEQVRWLRMGSELDPNNFGFYFGMVWTFLNLEDNAALTQLRERMLENVDEDHVNIAWIDMLTTMGKGNYAGALEYIPLIRQRLGGVPYISQVEGYLHVLNNDPVRARAAFEAYLPAYFAPEQWRDGIIDNPQDACIAAWTMIDSGDPALGMRLVNETLEYLENELPRYVDHPDNWGSEMCFVVRGDIDAALDVMETRFAHRHFDGWFFYEKYPFLTPLVREPRFQALDEQWKVIQAQQREAIAQMESPGASL